MTKPSKGQRLARKLKRTENLARGMRTSSLAIEAQSALLSTVFALSPDGIAFIDANLIVRAANQSLAKQIQIPFSRLLGRPANELMPALMEEIAPILESVRDTGEPFQADAYPYLFNRRSRSVPTYWDTTISPVYAPNASFLGYMVLLRDVTERKRAEEERERLAREQSARGEAEAQARHREAVFEAVPDAILVVDKNGGVVATNHAVFDLFGLPDRDALPGPARDIARFFEAFDLEGRPHPRGEWGIFRALRGERVMMAQSRLRLHDGRERLVQTCAAPILDDRGEVVQAVAVIRDVTDLRRLERRREVLSEIGQALSQGLDLNTVLQTVADRSLLLLGADAVNVMLADEDHGEFVTAAFRSRSAEPFEILQRIPFDARTLASRAFATGEIQVVEDIAVTGAEFEVTRALAEGDRARSFVGVPLRAGSRSVGALTIISRTLRRFSDEDVETIQRMAEMCGWAIENARLYQEVQRRAAQMDATISSIADGLMIFGPDGEIISMNRSAEDILRFTESERELPPAERLALLRTETQDGRPSDGQDALPRRALRGEVVRGLLLKVILPDDRTVWVGANSAPISTPKGDLLGAVMSFTDVTERRKARAELQRLIVESQRHADELDALIESMAEGVLVADSQGNVVRINRAGREMFGFPDPESVPPIVDVLHQNSTILQDGHPLPKDQWPIIRALRGETFDQQEVVRMGGGGEHDRRNLLISGSAVRNADGEVMLAVNVFREITPIRDLEREREEFVSVVAHELRSAMTTVRGYSEYLSRPVAAGDMPESLTRALEAISSSSRRVERMIADLLDVSRIEAHRLTLKKESVHLPALVPDIIFRSRELLKGRQVKVEVVGEVRPVEADADRVEQVLANLLSNAEKYSYPDTEIRVDVEARPGGVQSDVQGGVQGDVMVSVTNLGDGIPPEEQDSLFLKFRRARQHGESRAPGLGLGLYIARGLVEAHGGRIWVECEPGKHTTFRFTLPL